MTPDSTSLSEWLRYAVGLIGILGLGVCLFVVVSIFLERLGFIESVRIRRFR